MIQNKKNIGSNKTFELLTSIADGDYIAYCDQDDIWEQPSIHFFIIMLIHPCIIFFIVKIPLNCHFNTFIKQSYWLPISSVFILVKAITYLTS